MSLSSGSTPAHRSFGRGTVAPAGWRSSRGQPPSLTGTVAAVSASVAPARWRCGEFAESVGASAEAVDAVMLAVSEAVTNVVLYAYPDGRTGVARVKAVLLEPRRLVVEVSDDGIGIPESGGRGQGLRIVDGLTTNLDVVSKPGDGTTVEMTFQL